MICKGDPLGSKPEDFRAEEDDFPEHLSSLDNMKALEQW